MVLKKTLANHGEKLRNYYNLPPLVILVAGFLKHQQYDSMKWFRFGSPYYGTMASTSLQPIAFVTVPKPPLPSSRSSWEQRKQLVYWTELHPPHRRSRDQLLLPQSQWHSGHPKASELLAYTAKVHGARLTLPKSGGLGLVRTQWVYSLTLEFPRSE